MSSYRLLRLEGSTRLSEDELRAAMAAFGRSRFLLEEPFTVEGPAVYLARRIGQDIGCPDAKSFVTRADAALTGLLVVRFPAWDLEHFGFPVARVEHLQYRDPESLRILADCLMDVLRRRRVRMCSARLYGDSLALVRSLEDRGFRYQETILTPWRDLSTWTAMGFGVTRETLPEDLPRLFEIARSAFRTDRFHRDDRFDASAADGVYEKWVESWHHAPRPGRHSRVLTIEGRVVGFIVSEVEQLGDSLSSSMTHLVLGGLDPRTAGRGLGYRMYCDCLDEAATQSRFASAAVAAANPAVVNLYAKLGFRLTSNGEVTLHWWATD